MIAHTTEIIHASVNGSIVIAIVQGGLGGLTFALLGLPCGQVVSARRLKDDDHVATCSDGNRYRVYVNAQGRVAAEKR